MDDQVQDENKSSTMNLNQTLKSLLNNDNKLMEKLDDTKIMNPIEEMLKNGQSGVTPQNNHSLHSSTQNHQLNSQQQQHQNFSSSNTMDAGLLASKILESLNSHSAVSNNLINSLNPVGLKNGTGEDGVAQNGPTGVQNGSQNGAKNGAQNGAHNRAQKGPQNASQNGSRNGSQNGSLNSAQNAILNGIQHSLNNGTGNIQNTQAQQNLINSSNQNQLNGQLNSPLNGQLNGQMNGQINNQMNSLMNNPQFAQYFNQQSLNQTNPVNQTISNQTNMNTTLANLPNLLGFTASNSISNTISNLNSISKLQNISSSPNSGLTNQDSPNSLSGAKTNSGPPRGTYHRYTQADRFLIGKEATVKTSSQISQKYSIPESTVRHFRMLYLNHQKKLALEANGEVSEVVSANLSRRIGGGKGKAKTARKEIGVNENGNDSRIVTSSPKPFNSANRYGSSSPKFNASSPKFGQLGAKFEEELNKITGNKREPTPLELFAQSISPSSISQNQINGVLQNSHNSNNSTGNNMSLSLNLVSPTQHVGPPPKKQQKLSVPKMKPSSNAPTTCQYPELILDHLISVFQNQGLQAHQLTLDWILEEAKSLINNISTVPADSSGVSAASELSFVDEVWAENVALPFLKQKVSDSQSDLNSMKASKNELARRKLLAQSTNLKSANLHKNSNPLTINTPNEALNSSNDVLEKAKTIIDAINNAKNNKNQTTSNLLQNLQSLNSPGFANFNSGNLNISTDSIESTGLNHSNGLTGLNLNGLSDGLNIRPAKVSEITYAPETQSDYKLINHGNHNDSQSFTQNNGQNRLSNHHKTSNHAQNKSNADIQNQAVIDILKRRSKSPNTTDSTDGGLSFTTNGNTNGLDAGNGASDFVIKAIQELATKVQQLYDELIREKEANSKFKNEMEKKFDAVVLRLEAAENKEKLKESGNINSKKVFDNIGDPVSALRSVQSTSTPIKNESSSVVADSQKAANIIDFDGEDLQVEVLDSGEALKNDMMQCLAAMKKTNYTGSEVAKESEEGKRLAQLQATLRDLDNKQDLVKRDLDNLENLEETMNTE